ncbi:ABC transporter substrate-binding protein [Nocardioides caldifontis]|uniref:ABC transporter substrate-binding protein n=1 Tax=Nocardioides caldifontis TaxID=2588938 RepID=UPI0013968F97|nr:ABC transporter substrate-binding protein [Nocardioides caldifontis]
MTAASALLLLAACGSGDAAGDDSGVFKFAVVTEKTGAYADYGLQLEAGVQAAVKDLNASGDYDIEFEPVIYDCQSDKSICVQHAREAVTAEGLSAVIGPIVSVDILPAAEVTERAKVPHLVMAVLNQITDDYTNTFRWSVQSDRSNQTVVDYVEAKMKPGDTVAIVNATTDFGMGGAAQQTEQLAAIGIEPVASIPHDPDQADYTPIITELKKADPTYVLLSDSNPADIAKLLRQAKELGLKSTWIGADASGAIQLAGDAAEGYLTVSPWFPGPDTQELTDKLVAEGIKTPGWISAMAYDATLGLAEAVDSSGTSPEEVTKGLESLSDFDGLARTGWTFSADDRRGQTTSQIAEWTGTEYKIVWPEN